MDCGTFFILRVDLGLFVPPAAVPQRTDGTGSIGTHGMADTLYGQRRSRLQMPFPHGSHEDGTCAPCVFFPHGCCTKGDECRYCHDIHGKVQILSRTRKTTRDFLKNQLAASFADKDRHEIWNQSASRHVYARRLIRNILDARTEGALVVSLEL
eukprot:s697_g2.t1